MTNRIFIDTEFIDAGPGRPLELLSIGMVDKDDREFYAVNVDADKSQANLWVRHNVLPKLDASGHFRSRNRIRQEVLHFVGDEEPEFWGWCSGYDYVLLSQLIGFNTWPDNWPFYIHDIQQVADEEGIELTGEERDDEHNALEDAKEVKRIWWRLQ